MQVDRTGLVHLWVHFTEVCYKSRIIVEGDLQTIKLGRVFAGSHLHMGEMHELC